MVSRQATLTVSRRQLLVGLTATTYSLFLSCRQFNLLPLFLFRSWCNLFICVHFLSDYFVVINALCLKLRIPPPDKKTYSLMVLFAMISNYCMICQLDLWNLAMITLLLPCFLIPPEIGL